MGDHDADQKRRQNFLSLFLTVLGGFFFLLLLVLLSGGFFVYVLQAAGGIAGVALLHWALWGRSMEAAVAGEREEEQLRERAEADGWPVPGSSRFRRE